MLMVKAMFESCLICTNFTDGLDRLAGFVGRLGECGFKQIVFVHSVPILEDVGLPRVNDAQIAIAQKRLNRVLSENIEGVEVRVEVHSGRPTDTIARVLSIYNSDLVILGTPVRSSLQDQIFGSTTMGLLKSMKTPVLMLRPQLISVFSDEELGLRCRNLWRSLLIPYNDSERARYLVEQVTKHHQASNNSCFQECIVASVIDETAKRGIPVEYRVQETEMKLAQIKTKLEQLDLRVVTEIKTGNPIQKTLELANNYHVSAIAVASDNRNNLVNWTIPSFANELLHRSWFPILLFFVGK